MRTSPQLLAFGFKNFKGQSNPNFKNINCRKNYYQLLEVGQDASLLAIRKSYMSLVKKYHPDFNPTGQAHFTELQEAYKVLSNCDNRNYYDNNNIFFSPPDTDARTREENLNQKDQ